jgi:hypothetical protein
MLAGDSLEKTSFDEINKEIRDSRVDKKDLIDF